MTRVNEFKLVTFSVVSLNDLLDKRCIMNNYPIADEGDDFDPDTMGDYQSRFDSGEFTGKTQEEIRSIYRDEERQRVEDAVDAANAANVQSIEDQE